MQARKEKDLCFNCDEKFHHGHRCKPQNKFLLLTVDDDTDDLTSPLDLPPTSSTDTSSLLPPPEISLHALAGQPSPRTLRIHGSLHQLPIQILIDSGSTHNFIQERVACHLNLPIETDQSFSVTVGNGESLQCIGHCPKVPIVLSDHTFLLDLFVFPLHGADIVLGVQWLRTLGPVTFDYTKMTFSFSSGPQSVTLQGGPSPELHLINYSQFKRGLHTDSYASFY